MEEKITFTEAEFRKYCDDAIEASYDEESLGREILARVWQRLGERDPYGPVFLDGYWATLDRVLTNRCQADFYWHRIIKETVGKAHKQWPELDA